MRIVEARVGIIGGTLPRSVGNARQRWSERRGVLLVLRDDEDRIGLGEASPLPGYSPDTLDECEAEIRAGLYEGPHRSSAAAFAIQTAFLDLRAQRAGVSISQFLLHAPGRSSITRCGLIDGEPATWLDTAARLQARGIRAFKVKVGRDARIELAALQALRKAIPSRAVLRLDANGAWSPEEARRRLESFRSLGVEFVEQPVAPNVIAQLGKCDVPWAADESLREGEPPACAVFILKPAVLDGFDRCLRIARGHACVASHLFDGPVALAACCELALTLSGPPLACGIDTHDALAAFPPMDVPQLRVPGEIVPTDQPGLGFSKAARQEIVSWIH